MKILYAAMYNDPTDLTAASGVDYNFYTQIKKYADETRIAGPFRMEGWLLERLMKKTYTRFTGKRYMKWNLRATLAARRGVNQAEKTWQPDIVFSMFPPNLAFYSGKAPAVFVTDLTFRTWQEHDANFGDLAFKFQSWMEKRAVKRSTRVITHSNAIKQQLIEDHQVNPDKIEVLVMPAALPEHVIPSRIDPQREKTLNSPFRLLLVGREYHRKGVDIAAQVVTMLNQNGIPAELIVCGTQGPAAPHLQYVGPFNKRETEQLKQYVDLYRWANLLIHPARFEPAGIVPGEAAAFGTPTITNDVGGLGTTVKDGASGIVLPRLSPAQSYALAITQLINEPENYYALCQSTRKRYEEELNWDVAGKHVYQILESVVAR